jgi:hypothetical protein
MKLVIGLTFCFALLGGSKACLAESIASMPNQGGGKIVLTNEVCKIDGKTYPSLNRAYNYTETGYGSEGCYTVEDDTVVVIWKKSDGSPQKMRYPAENFTITKKTSGGTRI